MVFGHADKSIEISLEVEGSDGPFFPGDKVNATVTLDTKQGGGVKKLHAGIYFQFKHQIANVKKKDDDEETSHKWVEEEKWVSEDNLLGEAELARGLNDTYTLQWTIPEDALPSYAGEIITNKYCARVDLERTEGKGLRKEVELLVVQPASGKDLESGLFGKVKNAHDANMQFELPKLEYVEGETLSGRLQVDPRVDIEAREIRLEWERVETVTQGDTENISTHKSETHKLAGITILKSGESSSYNFSFPVKIEVCPTFKEGDTEGAWLLRAVISRPLATDCEVEKAISLYCAFRQG